MLAGLWLDPARFFRAMPELARAGVRAVRLGLLNGAARNEVTLGMYASSEGFASRRHNLSGLWPHEEEAVQLAFCGCRSILVAGAGGGRELIALARRGIDVTGFDCSRELISTCREHLHAESLVARVLDAEPDEVPVELGLFEGVLVGRGVYHHIPSRKRRVDFLRQCREHLRAERRLLISDFFTRPESSLSIHASHFIADTVRRLRGSPESVELGDAISNCFEHTFVRTEIESELSEAGFRTERFLVTASNLAQVIARSCTAAGAASRITD